MSLQEFSADSGAAIADQAGDGTPAIEQFAVLDLALVAPSLTNPRKTFNEAKMLDLAESIKASGVHQPILVRPLPSARLDDTFRNRGDGMPLPTHELVSGERRWRASKFAGKTSIPAMVRSLTDAEVLEIQIIENLQRDDLTELEEAEGYQRLCDETGLAKEEIGERIGKSRAYVYSRLKLLALSNAGRDALRKGEIDASKGLLIARIPDEKLQEKALAEARRKNSDGDTISEREFKRWLRMNVMLKLADARFKIADATLRPDAGACTSCSKRTGAHPDLFADVDSPDICTDPACFHDKEDAESERLVAAAKAKGMNVIEGKEALELMPRPYSVIDGYRHLDEEVREALTDRELKGNVTLFVDPHTKEPVEVVSAALAQKAYAKVNQARQTPKERKVDKEREAREERYELELEYQRRWRAAAIAEITPRIKAGEIRTLSANLLRRVILELSGADQRCDEECASEALGLDNFDDELIASTLRSTDDNEIGYALLLTLLNSDRIARHMWNNGERSLDHSAPVIEDLASQLSISIDDLKAGVQAEIRDEREPKAPARDELAAPQEGSAKGKKSKPAARAAKAKTTPEEASASIAAALQELDAGPGGEAAVLAIGVAVRFKVGLKGPTGKARKVSGRAGVIESATDGERWGVRFGPASHEIAVATSDELEIVELSTGLSPEAAWPFPKAGTAA